jgi:CBS domain-containing protein
MNPHEHVETAIRLFMEKKIGAIMVCGPAGDLVGIITERDVLHDMATRGAETLNQNVEMIMSKAHTCKMDDKIRSVMQQMIHEHVRHITVVDGGELKGMISSRDLVKNQLDETQLEIDTMRDYARAH